MAKLRTLQLALVLLVAAAPTFAAAKIEHVVSPSGIEAWLIEDHTNPIISMRFAFRGGSALDPAGKEGLANMAAALLDEGAGELDSKAFSATLEDLSIGLDFQDGVDIFGGNLKTLVENKDTAFRLLRLALTEPRFDAEPVERVRSQILVGIRQSAEDPDTLASRTLLKTVFAGHPYGRLSEGTEESVNAITVADLKSFVAGRLARENLFIGVVGDITPAALAKELDAVFGKLPAKAKPWQLARVEPSGAGRTIVIEKAVPQSAIVFAEKGVMRADPDFYAAFVMNHILGGGGFTSRLYDVIREKRGLAYEVHSGLQPFDYAALIAGGAGTANVRVADTLQLLRQEWAKMAEKGVTQKELDDAKTFLTGSYPLRFLSSDRIASMLVGLQVENLGIDYPERRNGLIEKVTLDDVNRLAKKLLDPKRLTVVVVGKPEGVTSSP
ncbi:MAG: insulinase family protein [Rhodospirillales bacterium]|nr:insulinase family protein [Rhodospirillales bacterium]